MYKNWTISNENSFFGFGLTANSILVDTAKNGKDWYGAIKN
jgi:hypothetical protein